jgi:hypothetical protein
MDGKWRNVVSIGCVSANESFNLPNPLFEDHRPLLVVAPPSAININLAHVVAIPYPSRAVQFVDAPSSKFTPFEHDPHVGWSVVACGGHVAAAGRWQVQVSSRSYRMDVYSPS